MDNKRRTPANTFLIAQVFRAAIFAIVMVMLQDAPGFQIQLLVISSWFMTAILWRSRPYTRGINFCTVAFFELLYVWCCALSLMFSPEYIFRSYKLTKDMGLLICLLAFIALLVGVLLIIHSITWQLGYYRRIQEEAIERAREARRRQAERSMKPLEVVMEEVEESERASQREIHRQ